MKKMLLMVISFFSVILVADNHKGSMDKARDSLINHPNNLMSFKDCKDTKDGIAELLAYSESVWNQTEMVPENEEKWLEVSFLAELAANYSTVYDVWCKDMVNKRVKMRMMASKKKDKASRKKDD